MSFLCDWPDGGKQCGAEAEWFISGVNSDRPICTACLARVTPQPANHYSIQDIDPKRVPGPTFVQPIGPPDPWAGAKIPFQSVGGDRAYHATASGPQTTHISGFINNPMPPPAPAQPSRPPLKDAFADLASALLDLGIKKIEDWRKR